jgi:hypothetical protein
LGAFPIEIEIEDTDLTKDGNQSVKLSFKNVAQILADIYGVVNIRPNDDRSRNASILKSNG